MRAESPTGPRLNTTACPSSSMSVWSIGLMPINPQHLRETPCQEPQIFHPCTILNPCTICHSFRATTTTLTRTDRIPGELILRLHLVGIKLGEHHCGELVSPGDRFLALQRHHDVIFSQHSDSDLIQINKTARDTVEPVVIGCTLSIARIGVVYPQSSSSGTFV